MRTVHISLAGLVISLALPMTAGAYSSANRWGGTMSHSVGSTSASDRWGGSATHTAGEGTSATNACGGSAYHAEGSGYTNTWFQPAPGANGVFLPRGARALIHSCSHLGK